ncbi:hypothetical protein X743_31245 [Mesorhizobium sp. LNHC252B00]|nr:hypothetical protein X743_31245 [Mesorhizobium sp. LNHC252B00]
MSALALCLAAPAVASADDSIVIQSHRHHRHHYWNNDNAVMINQYGQRLHRRHHGQVTFYDQGRRHHRSGVMITGSVDRPLHRHRHVIIQQDDNSDSDY